MKIPGGELGVIRMTASKAFVRVIGEPRWVCHLRMTHKNPHRAGASQFATLNVMRMNNPSHKNAVD